MKLAPDLDITDPEDVLLWRELARRRLSWFSRYRIVHEGSGIRWTPYLEAIAEFLEAMDIGQILRGIINIPPRHRKSETVQDLHAWLIGKDPSKRSSLMNISYAAELAHDESRYCRQQLSEDWYRSLFPEVELVATADKRWSVVGGAQRFATGIGGTITGRGANWIVVDDPIKPDEADSDQIRTKTNQWLGRTLRSRLNDPKKGRVLIIMQRLHERDAVGYMEEIAAQGGSQWEKLVLPLKATKTTVVMFPGRDFCWKREKGELLEPERIGEREFTLLQIDMPHDFEGQFQQNPVKETGNFFKPDMLVEVAMDPHEIVAKHQLRPGAWLDLAAKEKETQTDDPDETVIAVMAKDRLRRLWILDMWGGTDDQWQVAQTIIAYDRKWGRLTWRAPKEALLHTLTPTMRVASKTLEHPMLITPMEGLSGDKVQRAQTLRALLNTGQVYVPKGAPWLPTLKRWLRAFPKGAHDDWCFPAWTPVVTKRGTIPICEVVAGDYVPTREGWREVLWSGQTGEAEIIRRYGVTGTPEHPVWTENRGFVRLDALAHEDIIMRWHEQKLVSSTAGSTAATPTPSTGTSGSTSPAMTHGRQRPGVSIAPYGSTTTARSRMARASTTGTETRSTTTRPTSPASASPSTDESMPTSSRPRPVESTWTESETGPRTGTRVPRGGSGIGNTRSSTPSGSRVQSAPVKSAGPASSQGSQQASDSAGTPAKCAVYNLSIAGLPEFVAWGVLVHNCDAPAYAALDMELGMRTGGERQMPEEEDYEVIAGRKVAKPPPDLRGGDRPWRS